MRNPGRFERYAGRIYREFLDIRHENVRRAVEVGDYSGAIRMARAGALRDSLAELLAIRPRSRALAPELLPTGYPIFTKSGAAPRERPIRVLAQLRDVPETPSRDYFGAIRGNKRFDVVNVGPSANADVVLRPGMTLDQVHRKLAGWRPDFFYSHQLEYQLLPVGLERAPYPVIGHVGDLDLHWPNSRRALRAFDVLTVVGSYDWRQARALTDRPVVVYPKIYAALRPPAEGGPKDRPFDLSFSGEITDPFRFDTQMLFDELTAVSDAFPMIDKCGLSEAAFYELLARTKVVPTYVRRWGAFSTRGLEALSAGCCILYQDQGELGLFFSESEGALAYRPDNVRQIAMEAIGHWPDMQRRAANGRKKAASDFAFPLVMDQYFEFLSFLAAGIDVDEAMSRRGGDVAQTPALISGWGGVFADEPQLTARRMYARALEEPGAEPAVALKARIALDRLDDLAFPTGDMMGLFNLGRHLSSLTADHRKRPAARKIDPARCFRDALKAGELSENVDCFDYLHGPDDFDYRTYLDLLWRGSREGKLADEAKREAGRIVRAFCNAHLFKLERDPSLAWEALREWPGPSVARFLLTNLDKELKNRLFASADENRMAQLLALFDEAETRLPFRFALNKGEAARFLRRSRLRQLDKRLAHFDKGKDWILGRSWRRWLRAGPVWRLGNRLLRRLGWSEDTGAASALEKGWRHFYRKRYSRAMELFTQAILGAHEFPARAYLGRGWSSLHSRRLEESLEDLSAVLNDAAGSDDASSRTLRQQALRGIGWARLRLGEPGASAAAFSAALDHADPGDLQVIRDARRGRSCALYLLGRKAQALEDFRASGHPFARAFFGELLLRFRTMRLPAKSVEVAEAAERAY